jgi:hypothetical protein
MNKYSEELQAEILQDEDIQYDEECSPYRLFLLNAGKHQ